MCGELASTELQSLGSPRSHLHLSFYQRPGDMQLAVSDMDIYRRMTPRVLAAAAFTTGQLVVIDTNLPAESIHGWRITATPLFLPTPCPPSRRKLRPVLGKLHTLKPNRLEAELLSGVHHRERQPPACADPAGDRPAAGVHLILGATASMPPTRAAACHVPPPRRRWSTPPAAAIRFHGGFDVGLPAGQRSGEVGPCGSGAALDHGERREPSTPP